MTMSRKEKKAQAQPSIRPGDLVRFRPRLGSRTLYSDDPATEPHAVRWRVSRTELFLVCAVTVLTVTKQAGVNMKGFDERVDAFVLGGPAGCGWFFFEDASAFEVMAAAAEGP